MEKKFAVVVLNNFCDEADVIECRNHDAARKELKLLYYDSLNDIESYDYNNTYMRPDCSYAQIVKGFRKTEFRVAPIEEEPAT